MDRKAKSGLSLIEMAVSMMILLLIIGITIPAVSNHIANQKLKKFAVNLVGNISLIRQDAKKQEIDPEYSGEGSPSSAPTEKVKVSYSLNKGLELPMVSDSSEDEIFLSFQGFSTFDQITKGSHLDIFLPGGESPLFSILFLPDGMPLKVGSIFLSTGKKTFSITVTPSGNVKFKED